MTNQLITHRLLIAVIDHRLVMSGILHEFCLQEEREARELVKREQDEAYQASLLQDRAKVVVFK